MVSFGNHLVHREIGPRTRDLAVLLALEASIGLNLESENRGDLKQVDQNNDAFV